MGDAVISRTNALFYQDMVINVNRSAYYYAAQWSETTLQHDLIETDVI